MDLYGISERKRKRLPFQNDAANEQTAIWRSIIKNRIGSNLQLWHWRCTDWVYMVMRHQLGKLQHFSLLGMAVLSTKSRKEYSMQSPNCIKTTSIGPPQLKSKDTRQYTKLNARLHRLSRRNGNKIGEAALSWPGQLLLSEATTENKKQTEQECIFIIRLLELFESFRV